MMNLKNIRPAWAEINLDLLKENIRLIRKRVGSAIKIMAVVKADGYGHGAVEVSKAAVESGVDSFAVAFVDEAIELRKAGIRIPILLISYTSIEEIDNCFKYDLTPTVADFSITEAINMKASYYKKKSKVHIRIDNGFSSFGVMVEHLRDFACKLRRLEWLDIEGAYMYLYYGSDGGREAVLKQFNLFLKASEILKEEGIVIKLHHLASSPAILDFPQSYMDMVRPGTAILGLPSLANLGDSLLRQVMQLKTKIMSIKEYDAALCDTYKLELPAHGMRRIAEIPLGYGDSMFFSFLEQGEVLIRGQRCAIIGKPSMDRIRIDITYVPDASTGDEVVIFGEQDGEEITINEVATRSKIRTFNCESVCFLSRRIPRVYIEDGKVCLIKTLGNPYNQAENLEVIAELLDVISK